MNKRGAPDKSPNKLLYYLGNTLMLASVVIFLYIVYPIISLYIFPQKVVSLIHAKGMYVTIPKIGAQAAVTENVDPYNKNEYSAVLKKSVAHAKGTSLPGEKGTVFIFAHSSGPPWELTRLNTVFLRLGELRKGDEIQVFRKNKKYIYIVREKKVVSPMEVGYLLHNTQNQLILQTCTPIGTDWQRLLVFANPK